jgi:hypothetical protein
MIRHATATAEEYDLQFEPRDQYLYCRVDGKTANFVIFRRILKDIAEQSAQVECTRVLFENKILDDVALTDMFRLVTDLPLIGFSRTRLAIVKETSGKQDNQEFANNVAYNRGIPMRAFGSIEAAETWLLR